MPLNVLIVDDEPLAREGLRAAIDRLGMTNLQIQNMCENAPEALAAIRASRPDILLLDISMPVMDGFAMLEQLEPEETPPAIIFITAFDEHAVRAFEAEALDFLVKPVADARLRVALERAERRIAEVRTLTSRLEEAEAAPVERYLERLVIPERGRKTVLPVREIEWIEGDTYYVRVHARARVHLLRERLSRLESLLDPAMFYRTHRSAIVRLELIREVKAESAYSYVAVLSTGARAPVSRERVKALEQRLTGKVRS